MKRTPIRRESKKRAALNRVRARVVADMKRDGPVLCARCGGRADDLHERLSRARRGSLTDPANLIPLCRADHDWVSTHPKEAALEGVSLSSYGGSQ